MEETRNAFSQAGSQPPAPRFIKIKGNRIQHKQASTILLHLTTSSQLFTRSQPDHCIDSKIKQLGGASVSVGERWLIMNINSSHLIHALLHLLSCFTSLSASSDCCPFVSWMCPLRAGIPGAAFLRHGMESKTELLRGRTCEGYLTRSGSEL